MSTTSAAAKSTQQKSVELQKSFELRYNFPLDLPPNFTAVANPTSQAMSVLQVENLSTSNVATFFINGGGVSEVINLPANSAQPYTLVHNFNGSKLEVSNISTRDAVIQIVLRST